MCRELNDKSKMPFGKYSEAKMGDKAPLMQDVPASYLHWLWCEMNAEDRKKPVGQYISKNIHNLKREYPKGDWEEAA